MINNQGLAQKVLMDTNVTKVIVLFVHLKHNMKLNETNETKEKERKGKERKGMEWNEISFYQLFFFYNH